MFKIFDHIKKIFHLNAVFKIAVSCLVCISFLVWGYAIGVYQIFPYDIFKELTEFIEGDENLVKEITVSVTGYPQQQLLEKNYFPGHHGLKIADDYVDPGYLLLAGLDNELNEHSVKLIRLSDGGMVHRWRLNYDVIFKNTPRSAGSYILPNKMRCRMLHPFLLNDGSIIFNVQAGPLVRIDSCSRHIWTNNRHFHHSLERDSEGNIWAPTVIYPSSYENKKFYAKHTDDAIAKLNPEGEVLKVWSLTKILERNGYAGLLFGVRKYEKDLLHLNDITPALKDGEFWKKGDLLLSIRHISSIALYRPSNDKIIWLQTGPWLNQHDANFLDDTKISIFGNDLIRDIGLFNENNISNVYIYDFKTQKIEMPYTDIITQVAMRSPEEARSKVLPNGDVFIEETMRGRLLRLSPNQVRWSYVNRYNQNKIGLISWSRYLEAKEVEKILPKLNCN